jgi:hypothetical protein
MSRAHRSEYSAHHGLAVARVERGSRYARVSRSNMAARARAEFWRDVAVNIALVAGALMLAAVYVSFLCLFPNGSLPA